MKGVDEEAEAEAGDEVDKRGLEKTHGRLRDGVEGGDGSRQAGIVKWMGGTGANSISARLKGGLGLLDGGRRAGDGRLRGDGGLDESRLERDVRAKSGQAGWVNSTGDSSLSVCYFMLLWKLYDSFEDFIPRCHLQYCPFVSTSFVYPFNSRACCSSLCPPSPFLISFVRLSSRLCPD